MAILRWLLFHWSAMIWFLGMEWIHDYDSAERDLKVGYVIDEALLARLALSKGFQKCAFTLEIAFGKLYLKNS
jgi:hypothetical protein